MKGFWKRQIFSFIIAIGFSASLMSGAFLTAHAANYQEEAEANKLMTVESNEIDGWPQGPSVSARSAILIEANTGTVLYAKNIHEKLYPASTTKILTAYIARQNSDLDEMVEYSADAVNSIVWWDDSNIGIKIGESITMEQSLYGLMVGSANECGNAIGEHISGSMEAFVDLMNETAKELGCTDSHFVTTNGKHDDEHYTSVHDMALIAQKYFSDELLCKMSNTRSYVIPASPTLSRELVPNSKNNLLAGKKYAYEYLVGSKTGYTDIARQNLVSCAEKDGMKLICVVMRDESPMQFTDTIDLFNYGFSNFKMVNVSENDTTYQVRGNSFFMTDNDIFGDSQPILSIDSSSCLVLPADVSIDEVDSVLCYDDLEPGQAASISYSYKGQPVGTASILFAGHVSSFDFNAEPVLPEETDTIESETASQPSTAAVSSAGQSNSHTQNDILLLDVKRVGIIAAIVVVLLIIALVIRSVVHNRRLTRRRRAVMNRRRSKKDEIIDFDRYIDKF